MTRWRDLVAEAATVLEHFWDDANARTEMAKKLRKALEEDR